MAKAFTTIAQAVRGGLKEKPARAYLIPLNIHKGDEPILAGKRSFQYFPSTIQDSQQTNYQTKVIPGLSHPLYQWTSGGARTISFQSIFTRDRSYSSDEKAAIRENSGKRESKLGNTFTLENASITSLSIMRGEDARNVDIPSAIAWLRSHVLPEYSLSGDGVFSGTPQRPRPPRKLILGIPGLRLNWGVPVLPPTEVFVIMTGCDVSYDSFFADGSPRIAKVALKFNEIIQVGGRITVHDASNRRYVGMGGYVPDDDNNGT